MALAQIFNLTSAFDLYFLYVAAWQFDVITGHCRYDTLGATMRTPQIGLRQLSCRSTQFEHSCSVHGANCKRYTTLTRQRCRVACQGTPEWGPQVHYKQHLQVLGTIGMEAIKLCSSVVSAGDVVGAQYMPTRPFRRLSDIRSGTRIDCHLAKYKC